MEIEVTDDIRVAPESKNMIRILSEAFEKRTPIDINGKQYIVVAKSNSVFSMRRVESVKAAEWTGEGLPPVGTVCEFMKHNSPPAPEGQWTVGDIRYVSDCYVIIGGEGCEHAHHPRNCSFRPVRTPEQIAAEAVEQRLAKDLELYGTSFALTNDDGTITRLDPTRVLIRGQAVSMKP